MIYRYKGKCSSWISVINSVQYSVQCSLQYSVQMARSSTVHCQSKLQGTVKNRSLLAGGVAFEILQCWKDDHLPTSEYSQQGKYKGEVTNTMENRAISVPWCICLSRHVENQI